MSVTTSTSPEPDRNDRQRESGKGRSLAESLAMPGLTRRDYAACDLRR